MKRYGKFEKRPDETEARQPKMKSLLLQTYVLSVLCLVLCMSMFLGSSYAWFTSEVNNTSNEIYIGTLDADLLNSTGDNLADPGNALFTKEVNWGPGQTNLEMVHIVNKGDLDFKYELSFTDGVLKETNENETESAEAQNETSVEAIASCFEVWVYKGTYENLDSYAELSKQNGWNKVGSLAECLNGKVVLNGVLKAKTTDNTKPTDTYTIALHMNKGTDRTLAAKAFGLTVKLVAYQLANEESTQLRGASLDTLTAVSNLEELEDVLSAGIDALLTSDIEIADKTDGIVLNGGLLQGSNSTISYTGDMYDDGNPAGVLITNGGSITGLTIAGGDYGTALYSEGLTSDLFVSNCTLSGAFAFNLCGTAKSEFIMNFTNTEFESRVYFENVMKHAAFYDCEFKDILRPYGKSTLTNCVFKTLDLSNLEVGESVVLTDCTYNGVSGINATLEATENGIEVECASGLITVADGLVVLAS